MPQCGSNTSYRVVGCKNSSDFLISRSLQRWARTLFVILLPLSGCIDGMGAFQVTQKPQLDFFDITGSLASDNASFSLRLIEDADRLRALAALGQALDPMNDGQASVWTGQSGQSRGSFLARGLAFVQDEQLCRNFIATIDHKQGGKDSERQQWPGTACRQGVGGAAPASWAVVELSLLANNR